MFFPPTFYGDLGLPLARVAADLESFLERQQAIFGDLVCKLGGDSQAQYHVELTLPSAETVRILTFPARTSKDVNPDVQFAALQRAFPIFDVSSYRSDLLRRLGPLVDDSASTQHRFVKFSYGAMQEVQGRARALAAFEWALGRVRCAAAVEVVRRSFAGSVPNPDPQRVQT